MKVAIIGLGKLGLPMAVAIASRGIPVYGVEKDPKRIRLIRQGRSPIEEPGIEPKLKALIRTGHFRCTDYAAAVRATDVAFVAVNTPERSAGEMDIRDLETCISEIGKALKNQSKFYIVAISSTVIPETIDRSLRPILEQTSGRKIGQSIGLCANPVFIALTTVVRDFLNPPVVVVGASDSRTAKWVSSFYKKVCENRPPVLTTSPYTAEVIKLAHNAYCTSKMAFINEVADLCTKPPFGDIRKVEEFFQAGGERAGKFLKAGFGFGGPCFPRDLRLFVKYLEKKGLRPPLLRAVNASNDEHARELLNQIRGRLGTLKGKKIAVLGLSYKPGVRNFEDSFSLRLIQKLTKEKARVLAYDPFLTPDSLRNGLSHIANHHVTLKTDVHKALQGADLCVLAHPASGSLGLKKSDFYRKTAPVVLDPWGILSA